MKILVTGYKGFIGGHVYQSLIDDGHDVDGYDYDESHGCLPYVAGYDWVIHLGAISSTTETDINKIFLHNYDFSIRLLNQCAAYKVDFQYASSASVYGGLDKFDEDGDCRPISPYAWSKFMFDRYINIINPPSRIKYQGFRYFNVYGTNEQHKGDQASVFTKFKLQSEQCGSITLFENSDQYKRDFVCVDDVVEVHKQMLLVRQSGLYNVGTGTATSFQKIGELYSKKLNVPIQYIPMPDNLNGQYQSYTRANNQKLNSVIDVKWTTPKQWIDANVDEVKDIDK